MLSLLMDIYTSSESEVLLGQSLGSDTQMIECTTLALSQNRSEVSTKTLAFICNAMSSVIQCVRSHTNCDSVRHAGHAAF